MNGPSLTGSSEDLSAQPVDPIHETPIRGLRRARGLSHNQLAAMVVRAIAAVAIERRLIAPSRRGRGPLGSTIPVDCGCLSVDDCAIQATMSMISSRRNPAKNAAVIGAVSGISCASTRSSSVTR